MEHLEAKKPSPSLEDYRLARIQAEDLFEVKVEIIQLMAGLDPTGDWMGRGARALFPPRERSPWVGSMPYWRTRRGAEYNLMHISKGGRAHTNESR